MSNLKVGIVGLPNVGKSTLFNALLKKQQAYAANFPFATIEPNVGIVPVPDPRLAKLAEVIKESERMDHLPPEVPATVEVLDIAGLVEGAHKGEGLGNKFLSHIREVDAIAHVVRVFTDEGVIRAGSTHPKQDFEIVNTELALADLQTLENQKEPKGAVSKEEKQRWVAVVKLRGALEKGLAARDVLYAVEDSFGILSSEEEQKIGKQLGLLTAKPILVVLNVNEESLKDSESIEEEYAKELGMEKNQVTAICAKTEAELADLSEEEQKDYLSGLGISESGLERLVRKMFATLGLITYLTGGEKEVRAWTVKNGTNAANAAGEIHTDFIKKFIRAEVVSFDGFIEGGGWKRARELGKARLEGTEYIVKDGDVVEFKIGA